MGPPGPRARPLPPVCAAWFSRYRAPARERKPGQRQRNLELPHDRGSDALSPRASRARGHPPIERTARHCDDGAWSRRRSRTSGPAGSAGQSRRSSSASPRQKAGGCRTVRQGSQAGEEACGAAGPQGQIGVGLTQCGLVSQVSSGSFAEKEVSPAVSAVQSRQARLREHLCRRERSPARALANACAVLVPHTTRRKSRSRGA